MGVGAGTLDKGCVGGGGEQTRQERSLCLPFVTVPGPGAPLQRGFISLLFGLTKCLPRPEDPPAAAGCNGSDLLLWVAWHII